MSLLSQKEISAYLSIVDKVSPKERLKISQLLEHDRVQRCQESFLFFVQQMWPVFISGRHHKIMADAFERVARGELKRLIVNMPPRHTKSEFASYLLPAWFLGKFPEKKIIQTYTVIPDFTKVGYEMIAFTFAKAKTYRREDAEKMIQRAKEWTVKRSNVVMASDGEGLGKDTVIVSLHRNYSEYANFMRSFAVDWADYVSDFQSFIVSLRDGLSIKPFDLKYLADDIRT